MAAGPRDVSFSIAVSMLLMHLPVSADIVSKDYCNGEHFAPSCGADSLMLIHEASYGRMADNDCIPTTLGRFGCQSDVITYFDDVCSGNSDCDVMVTDSHIRSRGGCMKGLMKYLRASYSCHKALSLPNTHCAASSTPEVGVELPEVYLSKTTIRNSCLPSGRPWMITASQGQRLNLTLITLGKTDTYDNSLHRDVTREETAFGDVTDPVSKQRVLMTQGSRYSHLMYAQGHSINVELEPLEEMDGDFLLRIQVIGCASVQPPAGAWTSRDDDVMQMGCHVGDKVWTLTCEGNRWTGAAAQCGEEEPDLGGLQTKSGGLAVSPNVLVFAVCCLLVLLSTLVFLAAACVLKRRNPEPMYAMPPTESEYFSNLTYNTKLPQTPEPCDLCTCDLIANTLPRVHNNHDHNSHSNCHGNVDNDSVFHHDVVNNNTHFHTVAGRITHAGNRFDRRSRNSRPSVGSSIYGNTMPPRSRRGPEPEYHSLRFSYPTLEFGGRERREIPEEGSNHGGGSQQGSIPRKTVEYNQYVRSDTSDAGESARYFVLEQSDECID